MTCMKKCSWCGKIKTFDEFHNKKGAKSGKRSDCKKCHSERTKNQYEEYYRNQCGKVSMYENKSCASYLGVVIGERLCNNLFKDVEVMPYGFPEYDIICNRGKKINVKTSTVRKQYKNKPASTHWSFNIGRNKVADYFILVAFDNVEDLNPVHMWMIPGNEINKNSGVGISATTIHRWDRWVKDIEDVKMCCTELKSAN